MAACVRRSGKFFFFFCVTVVFSEATAGGIAANYTRARKEGRLWRFGPEVSSEMFGVKMKHLIKQMSVPEC